MLRIARKLITPTTTITKAIWRGSKNLNNVAFRGGIIPNNGTCPIHYYFVAVIRETTLPGSFSVLLSLRPHKVYFIPDPPQCSNTRVRTYLVQL